MQWAKNMNKHLSKEEIQMTQGHMKNAHQLVITEMQIKSSPHPS